MRSLAVVIAVIVAIPLPFFAASPETKQVDDLVARLGSAGYRERETAFRALDELGEAGLPALRVAVTSGDSEISRRAADLIRRIEQRVATAKILAPTLVEITIDNKPVSDAIGMFKTQIGKQLTGWHVSPLPNLPISLGNFADSAKLRKRTMTYRTNGKIPVWQALEEFCKGAELSEWDGLTLVPGMPLSAVSAQLEAQSQVVVMQQRGRVFRSSTRQSPALHKDIFLYDGLSNSAPTHITGAARIRVLPQTTPVPYVTFSAEEIVVPLQVSVESRIGWGDVPVVNTAQAIDDRGQKLTASLVSKVASTDGDDDFMFINAMAVQSMQNVMVSPRSQYVALRFRRGPEQSTSLRELTGSLSLPIKVYSELLTIDHPLTAAGKTARCDLGPTLTVHSTERLPSGDVKLEITALMPADFSLSFAGNQQEMHMPGRQPQVVNGRVAFNSEGPHFRPGNVDEFAGVSASDANRKRLPISSVQNWKFERTNSGASYRMTLQWKLPADAPPPERLSFHAIYPTATEVAFSFKDVPVQ